MNISILLTISLLGLSLSFIAFFYLSLIKKYDKLRAEEERMKFKIDKHHDEIIDKARSRARLIIEKATEFDEETKKKFANDLELTRAKLEQNYQEVFTTTEKKAEAVIDQLIIDLEATLTADFKNSEKEILAKFEKSLETYKNEYLTNLNQRGEKTIKDAAFTVLGKSLNLAEHEEIILKAVSEAKAQNLI